MGRRSHLAYVRLSGLAMDKPDVLESELRKAKARFLESMIDPADYLPLPPKSFQAVTSAVDRSHRKPVQAKPLKIFSAYQTVQAEKYLGMRVADEFAGGNIYVGRVSEYIPKGECGAGLPGVSGVSVSRLTGSPECVAGEVDAMVRVRFEDGDAYTVYAHELDAIVEKAKKEGWLG